MAVPRPRAVPQAHLFPTTVRADMAFSDYKAQGVTITEGKVLELVKFDTEAVQKEDDDSDDDGPPPLVSPSDSEDEGPLP